MRALVISGGGSKGAFAGGVAQYLIEERGRQYDMYLGTSTGSLLIPHLAVNKITKLHEMFTSVQQQDIFSVSPFVQRKKGDREYVSIDFVNSLWQFIRQKRTFGESKALKKAIKRNFTEEEYHQILNTKEDLVVTVVNLSTNTTEYKSIKECTYEEFCQWIWISCNYVPFMSLVKVDGYEYADGGLGCVVPIREAIQRGATEVDAIILKSENLEGQKVLGKNPFSLMLSLFGHVMDQLEKHDILIGKLAAKNRGVTLNLYYTPTELTENSLIFSKRLMRKWWQQGYDHAKEKHEEKASRDIEL
ncbi:patatin-like phospholipase family protein [Mangrovimonas sp. AS39]|uniref:patatin-like phospholipase family protein n=1 Tax=Mangrovimonas futianensis TaxID=2895523 RepID=UPI001E34AD11|nr:patatin-like phospholipase family protein [Mangrovimonas futianensis]MCF1192345.1 patatin-like phospholipase family protein [Mangrovimonas futianensis]MCF1195906.1 patatin-like phospholipase family protein [Mangrovimonas futianensis]